MPEVRAEREVFESAELVETVLKLRKLEDLVGQGCVDLVALGEDGIVVSRSLHLFHLGDGVDTLEGRIRVLCVGQATLSANQDCGFTDSDLEDSVFSDLSLEVDLSNT